MSAKPPVVETRTSAPFWEGVRQRRFMLQYDTKAGRYQFFPRPISLHSNDGTLEWRESKGTGALVAFTLTYFPAPGFDAELPYLEGLIQLDEGPRVFAPIARARYEQLQVGMRMRVCWPEAIEGAHPFQFEPAP
jgi:uncharacterized OB-fold protein